MFEKWIVSKKKYDAFSPLVEWYDRQLKLVEGEVALYQKGKNPHVDIYDDHGRVIITASFETDAQAENYYDKINKQLLAGHDFIVCGNETVDRRLIKGFKLIPAKTFSDEDKQKYIESQIRKAMEACAVYIPTPKEYLGGGEWKKDELWNK